MTSPAVASCEEQRHTARAVEPHSGVLLYFERHRQISCDGTPTEGWVTYLDRHGDTLATKNLDYRTGLITPSITLDDRQTGYREGARVVGDSLLLFRRYQPDADTETSLLGIDRPAAIDAGFDHAVRRHWQQLSEGERIVFDFAVPDKLRTFRFRIRRLQPPSEHLRLRIEPDSFWLRWIAPHIDLTYDVEQRRLLVYEGITDMRRADGRRHRARIDINYGNAP